MAQTLQAVFALNNRYTAALTKILHSQDEFARKQELADKATEVFKKRLDGLRSSADNAGTGVSGLAAKIGGLVSAAYLGKKALESMFAAINLADLQRIQETTFQALTHSDRIGSQLYEYVSRYAEKSALGREDVAKGVISALTVTRDINQIEQFIKMIERLYAKDPTKGAQQAVFSLKELLAGDVVSARGVYGITGISGDYIRKLTGAGDIQGVFDYIGGFLDKFGATQEVVDKNFYSLSTQTNLFKTNLKTAIADFATPTMENLAGVMRRLNEAMEAGKFQPFIALMVYGMDMIGNGIAWVVENLNWIAPTLVGVMTALIIYNGVMKVVNTTTQILGITTGILTGGWVKAAAALAAFIGSAAAISAVTKSVDTETKQSIADIKNQLGAGLAGTADIDAHITNTDPIKVTGEVEIEKENMRYLLDAASQKFYAQFSTAMLAPQVNIYGQTIEKTADIREVLPVLAEGLTEAGEAYAEGVY